MKNNLPPLPASKTAHNQNRSNTKTEKTTGCETSDLRGNLIAEADAIPELGPTGCVLALLGVLMGEYEVPESCDGDKKCHGGKGASKVADNTNNTTVFKSTGTLVSD